MYNMHREDGKLMAETLVRSLRAEFNSVAALRRNTLVFVILAQDRLC